MCRLKLALLDCFFLFVFRKGLMNGLAIAIIFVLEIWLSDKEPLNGKDDIHLYNNNINIFVIQWFFVTG